MGIELSSKDRSFADRYFGGPDDCRGNAKRCWLHFHPQAKERSAEELGSRMLRKVEVNHAHRLEDILTKRSKAIENAAIKRKLELVE